MAAEGWKIKLLRLNHFMKKLGLIPGSLNVNLRFSSLRQNSKGYFDISWGSFCSYRKKRAPYLFILTIHWHLFQLGLQSTEQSSQDDSVHFVEQKNTSTWNFLSPEPEVTCGTVSIIIRVVLLPPYLRIRGVSLSSIHYNQSHRVYINRTRQYICVIWN